MSVAVELGTKPVKGVPNGISPVADGPSGVDRAGGIADGVIEVQRGGSAQSHCRRFRRPLLSPEVGNASPYLFASPLGSGLPSPSRS